MRFGDDGEMLLQRPDACLFQRVSRAQYLTQRLRRAARLGDGDEVGLLQVEALQRRHPGKGIGIVVEFDERLLHFPQRRQRLPAQAGAADAQDRDGGKAFQRGGLFGGRLHVVRAAGNAQQFQAATGLLLLQPVQRAPGRGQRSVIRGFGRRTGTGKRKIQRNGKGRVGHGITTFQHSGGRGFGSLQYPATVTGMRQNFLTPGCLPGVRDFWPFRVRPTRHQPGR